MKNGCLRSEEHTSELQSHHELVCRLLLEKKNRGLIRTNPTVGWGLMLGTVAILGMPPFGVFASEFIILTTAMREHAWATPFLLVALGVAFAAIFSKVQPMVLGETTLPRLPHPPALVPVFTHLGLFFFLGLRRPPISTLFPYTTLFR